MTRGSGPQSGFTFIEILVALAILGLILASFAGVVSGRSLAAGRLDSETQGLLFARSMMERVGRDLPLAPGDWSGSFPGGGQWRLSVRPADVVAPPPAGSGGFLTYVVELTVVKRPVKPIKLVSLRAVPQSTVAP